MICLRIRITLGFDFLLPVQHEEHLHWSNCDNLELYVQLFVDLISKFSNHLRNPFLNLWVKSICTRISFWYSYPEINKSGLVLWNLTLLIPPLCPLNMNIGSGGFGGWVVLQIGSDIPSNCILQNTYFNFSSLYQMHDLLQIPTSWWSKLDVSPTNNLSIEINRLWIFHLY